MAKDDNNNNDENQDFEDENSPDENFEDGNSEDGNFEEDSLDDDGLEGHGYQGEYYNQDEYHNPGEYYDEEAASAENVPDDTVEEETPDTQEIPDQAEKPAAVEKKPILDKKAEDIFENTRMSFGDHLLELRSCIISSLYGIVAGFIACLILGKYILGLISLPLMVALQKAGNDPQLYVQAAPESFMTYLKVSFFCGLFLSSPWTFRKMWGFIAAGLYPNEKRFMNIFAPFSATLFVLGGIFFILVVAPISLNFFITFSQKWQTPVYSDNVVFRSVYKIASKIVKYEEPPQEAQVDDQTETAKAQIDKLKMNKPMIKPLFTLQKYVSLVAWLAVVFGLAFQMPLVVLILGRIGLVGLDTLKAIRKYMIFGIVVVAAFITPPDVVSQVALSIPMYILYEFGILLLRFWPKHKRS